MARGEMRGLFRSTEGVAIAEFAISLPLLLVLVVGIFDFGKAFNVKQKVTGAAREGARFAASMPTNDLYNGGTPQSVNAIRDTVDSYLQAEKINDCGLAGQAGTPVGGSNSLKWQYTAAGSGCPGTLTLVIARSYSFTTAVSGQTLNIISTQVTLQYPYTWQFNRVIGFVASGSTYANGVTLIKADAVVPNID